MRLLAQQITEHVSAETTTLLRREAVIHEVILSFNANEINYGECELFVDQASKWDGESRQPMPFQGYIGKARAREYYGTSRPPELVLRELTEQEQAVIDSGGHTDFLTPGQLLDRARVDGNS